MSKKLEDDIKRQFKNKIILISGGTGSIGTGIVKQLLQFKPKMIKILTNDEKVFKTGDSYVTMKLIP